ncbi:MAG: hypothetical protein U9Q90_07695 [Campylobacterota bacterium]|nr:hypothetical protein [Campylobacterota bacterium]
MKKLLITATAILAVVSISASAEDALKNSLMPTETKAKPAVDLDNLNVGAKPVQPAVQKKSRPGTAVIATVDGHPIYKKNADEFLKLASKGKVSDYDMLPKQQQSGLLESLASTVLIEERSKKEVTAEEKNKLAAQYWVSQQMKKISVTDEEAKKFYEKNKKAFKDKDGKQLEYDKVENYVKMTVKQQKFTGELMKTAKVVVK